MTKLEGAAEMPVKTRRARYTREENEMLYEHWWDPMKRRELPRLIGRNLTALRSQFCRLLKVKGVSNDEYYRLMGEKHGLTGNGRKSLRPRIRPNNERDEIILEVFAKHHALGNTKTKACEELHQLLGLESSNSAIKLRFYRLMNRRGLSNKDLMEIGRKSLQRGSSIAQKQEPIKEQEPQLEEPEPRPPVKDGNIQPKDSSDMKFLVQLADLPRDVAEMKQRLGELEEAQHHQLDLRGFIEHLLAVERDLKAEDRLRAEIQNQQEQSFHLTQELASERKRIHAREEELDDVYQLLNNVLDEFMNLESVAKLASLGDFIRRLQVTVDQFGNVLKCRRV